MGAVVKEGGSGTRKAEGLDEERFHGVYAHSSRDGMSKLFERHV